MELERFTSGKTGWSAGKFQFVGKNLFTGATVRGGGFNFSVLIVEFIWI